MIHDKYIELMNQEIDEVNSKEESLELEEKKVEGELEIKEKQANAAERTVR